MSLYDHLMEHFHFALSHLPAVATINFWQGMKEYLFFYKELEGTHSLTCYEIMALYKMLLNQ